MQTYRQLSIIILESYVIKFFYIFSVIAVHVQKPFIQYGVHTVQYSTYSTVHCIQYGVHTTLHP